MLMDDKIAKRMAANDMATTFSKFADAQPRWQRKHLAVSVVTREYKLLGGNGL